MKTKTQAIYNHTTGRIHSMLTADGLCAYSGKTPQQIIEASDEDLEQMVFSAAVDLADAACRARHCRGPEPISKEHYEEMLNVLPPENWTRNGDIECFRLSERLDGPIATFFVKVGNQHYRINEDAQEHAHNLIHACMDHTSMRGS